MLWRRLLDGWVFCGFYDTHSDIRSQYSILDSYSTRQSRFPGLLLYKFGVRTLELFLSLPLRDYRSKVGVRMLSVHMVLLGESYLDSFSHARRGLAIICCIEVLYFTLSISTKLKES